MRLGLCFATPTVTPSTPLLLRPQNLDQVVPAVVQLLGQLPRVWLTPQTGPKQVQADYTQVMMDLRRWVAVSRPSTHTHTHARAAVEIGAVALSS